MLCGNSVYNQSKLWQRYFLSLVKMVSSSDDELMMIQFQSTNLLRIDDKSAGSAKF